MKFKVKYLGRHLEKGDEFDQRPEQYFVRFEDLDRDMEISFKETKLFRAAKLKKGIVYNIKIGEKKFAIEVKWDGGKVYMKDGNSIIRENEKGEKFNVSANSFNMRFRKMIRETNKEAKNKK